MRDTTKVIEPLPHPGTPVFPLLYLCMTDEGTQLLRRSHSKLGRLTRRSLQCAFDVYS